MQGACMAGEACMVGGRVCMPGGMCHGEHAWLWEACMVRGHAW